MIVRQRNSWAWVALIVLIDSAWTVVNWGWVFFAPETNTWASISQRAWHIAHWPTDWLLRSALPPYRGDAGFYTPEGSTMVSEVWLYWMQHAACVAQTAVIAYVAVFVLIPFAVRLIQHGPEYQ